MEGHPFELSIGDLIAGCSYLGSYKTSSRSNAATILRLQCRCGKEIERDSKPVRYKHKNGEQVACDECGKKGASTLPELKEGDEVGGCEFLKSFKGGKSGGITYWSLKCECGTIIDRRASEHWYAAKRGQKKLCKNKHLHGEIKTGARFGRLTVVAIEMKKIKIGESRTENRGHCKCNCSCGTEGLYVLPELLKKGDVQSCGCYRIESAGDRFRAHGKTDTREFKLWYSAKERADTKGLPFDIELSDINIPSVCPVLGIPINTDNKDIRSDNSPSLDKFYPSKGYVKGNIQVISWRANRIKNDGTPEEWLRIAEWCQREDVRRKLEGN